MSQISNYFNVGLIPPGTFVQTLTGNTGGPVSSDGASNINVVGDGTTIDVVGNPGTNTLTISADGSVSNSFVTDAGTATPVLGVLNVLGGNNIGTTGAANNVTINLDGTTNHTVQLGNATGSLTSLANGTTGQVLHAVTGANDPIWSAVSLTADVTGILPIANGGTNASSFATVDGTVYYDGTRLVTTATGTANFVLTSNGAGVAPTYQAVSASGAVTSVNAGTNISITGTATAPIVNVAGTTIHTVQLGTGATGLTSLANGTTGQILTAVTGLDPSWQAPAASSISITGNTGGALTGNAFTFSGGTTGLSFGGAGTTETLSGTLAIANGGTNATSMATTDGTVYFDGTRLVTTATGTSGQFLRSAGAGVAPAYATLPASSISITGDTGGALTGAAFTFTALSSAGATIAFNGAGTTQTFNVSDANLNTFFGKNAGKAGQATNQSSAFGESALHNITSGNYNNAFGQNALNALTTGIGNIAIGTDALLVANGNYNFGMGFLTFYQLTTGSFNIGIGHQAGANYTGAESYNILIGESITGTLGENGVTRIGTPGQQTAVYIPGIDGVNVGSVAKVVTEASDKLGTATITAGTNISITPTANTITIAGTGAASFTWSVITANQNAAVNNGYICNKATTLVLTLPTTCAVGDIIEVTGINSATGWQLAQSAGQQIFFGTSSTTLGATGTLTSSAIRDSIKIVCVVANLTFNVLSSIGNITVV